MSVSLESGTSVSHYRVIDRLGAGGMGEVYKAEDATLGRAVALKVLPAEAVTDEGRVRRFIQEAKFASSLNHPSIVTIHEIGQAKISAQTGDERAIHYIAMELIDGSTLKRKIHDEQADLRTLLGYFAQCAAGLSNAHAAGLVHRDLKPDNIMVTRDGFAKVLDFGLAKLTIRESADGLPNDATAVHDITREGQIVGTAAYMSPEQIEGRAVDHRSDIFSFGAMLYEAATRRRPFEAASDLDVMHQILHVTPPSIDELAPAAPADLRRMIRRCLVKDPERRQQSMKDVAVELNDMVKDMEQIAASATSISTSLSVPTRTARSRRRLWITGVALAAILIAVAVFSAWRFHRAGHATAAPVAYNSMRIERLTTSGEVQDCAISPDAKYVAYVEHGLAGFTLLVRQIATGSDIQIVPPQKAGIGNLSFSRDGNFVLFVSHDSDSATGWALSRVPVLGGPPRKLLRADGYTKVSSSPDGSRFVFVRQHTNKAQNALVIAEADGSGERELAAFNHQDSMVIAPSSWSPDGKRIATVLREKTPELETSVIEIDVASAERRSIGKPVWAWITSLDWLPDGRALVITGNVKGGSREQIWLQPYPDGEPARITNDLSDYRTVAVSADGKTLAVVQDDHQSDLFKAACDDESGGIAFANNVGNRRIVSVSASALGSVVYSFVDEKGMDIGIVDRPGGTPRVLTTDGKSYRPTVSADGKRIAFTSGREQRAHVWIMNADGTGAKQLTRGSGEGGSKISRDGKTVFFTSKGTEGAPSVWRISADGGEPAKVAGPVDSYGLAPDDKRIAYVYATTEEGRDAFHLVVMTTDGHRIFSEPCGPGFDEPQFTADGNAIAYVETAGGVSNIFAYPFDGSPRRQLTHFKSGTIGRFDLMPDGNVVMTRATSRSDVVLIRDFRQFAP